MKKSILNVALDAWCATSPAAQQHSTNPTVILKAAQSLNGLT